MRTTLLIAVMGLLLCPLLGCQPRYNSRTVRTYEYDPGPARAERPEPETTTTSTDYEMESPGVMIVE